MTKTLTALATIATIGIAAVAAPAPAEARFRAGPFIGGLAAGAIIGGALLAPRYGYGYGYGYGSYDPYYADGYYGGSYAYGGCYRQRTWTPYGWRIRRVCY